MAEKKRWVAVCLFASAMAWMEAATVIYLRTLVGRIDPYQVQPLPRWASLEYVELVRELATMLMLATLAWLAGRTRRTRLGYFFLAFGVWDILYYVFLAVTIGWPRSLTDWDVLFLIPLPWWGPVIAPALIALGMAVSGTLITQLEGRPWPRLWAWVLGLAGVAVALLVFTSDSLAALKGGEEAVRTVLPDRFNWPLFVVALLMMSAVLIDVIRQAGSRVQTQKSDPEELKPAD